MLLHSILPAKISNVVLHGQLARLLQSAFLASLEKEEYNIQYQVHKTICALKVQQEKPKEKTPEELVPKEYHKFLKVFSKKESECMLL